MKRQILILVSVLALLVAGAAFAQSTLNTTAPGPTQQQEPGETNNNLPNPGNPVPSRPTDNQPVTEQGTVEGTAAESAARTEGQGMTTGTQSGTTTGSTSGTTTGTMDTTTGSSLNQQDTGVAPETEQGEGMDVDVDTGARASGAVDVDVDSTTDADTDASGLNETGETTTGQYGGDTGSLPATASELPSVALLGLLFLGAAFALRVYSKRNA